MKRLVYSPSINVWVKSDSGIFDLSPYVTNCMIDRRINSVSYADVTFRNPKISDPDFKTKNRFLFTEHRRVNADNAIEYGPMFHPMDPIIITMTRLRGRPIQVFTGFCDTTPYVQLYPGTAKLTASCTLKRLQYTYWDPALNFARQFLEKNGWAITPTGTAFNSAPQNTGNLNDSSIGFLLYKLLEEVGGWDPNDIYIQELPGTKISQLVTKLYQDTSREEASSIKDFHKFLSEIIGSAKYGNAGMGGTTGGGGNTGGTTNNDGNNNANAPQWFKNHEGEIFEATIYGPEPSTGTLSGIEGGTGLAYSNRTLNSGIVDPMNGPYVIAANKSDIPKNAKVYIWPNPFNYDGTFEMADTGSSSYFYPGSKHIDIYNSAGSAIASNTPHGGWNNVTGLSGFSPKFGGEGVRVKRA